ncbi:hypothetical protein NN561_007847 [Cricetulus griseus]
MPNSSVYGLQCPASSFRHLLLPGGDNQNDCWIFALAILLSSTFVYNSMGPINQPAIDQLHGSLPCIENAVLALSQTENAAAVQKAIAHYDQQMNQKLQLPTETLQELLNVHRACEKEAIKIFMENSFKDVNQVFLTQFVTELETKQEEFLKKNEQASSDRCLALLQDIFNPFEEDVKQGIYYKPGGYHLYIQKTRELKKKYYDEPRKGVQAEEVLQKFLQSKDDVTDTILQIDQELTVKEKESEVERMKAEAAQATAKIQEEMQQKIEQLLQEKEKSHEEHSKQLTEMMGKAQDQNKNMQQLVEQLVQQKGKSDEDHRKKLTEKVDEAQAKLRELQKEKEHLQNQMKCLEEKIKHLPEEKKKENHEYDQLREVFKLLKLFSSFKIL